MEASNLITMVLGTGLTIAVLTDLTTQRIPNWLTLALAVACLGLQSWAGQWEGLLLATEGLLVGLLCFLPFYLFGAMGAGDVKLLAAVGAGLGPSTVFVSALMTVIAGGLIALVYIGLRGGIGAMFRRYVCMILLMAQRQPQYLAPASDEAAALRFPYALAIACGTGLSVWLVNGQMTL